MTTDSSLPVPFTTPDIDCRDLDSFMFNVERLLASELWALSTGDEFKAAFALWCRAWKQIPAGSLPNDERTLAGFSGQPYRWAKVRGMALRGFVLCSDGRLYHPILCADARIAYAKKMAFRDRAGKGGRAKAERDKHRLESASSSQQAVLGPLLEPAQGQGQGQGQGGEGKAPPTPRAILVRELRMLGRSTAPTAVDEWQDFLIGACGVKAPDEVRIAIRVLDEQAQLAGVRLKYAKDAAPFGAAANQYLVERRSRES